MSSKSIGLDEDELTMQWTSNTIYNVSLNKGIFTKCKALTDLPLRAPLSIVIRE